MIIEHRTRDKHQNADILSKKTSSTRGKNKERQIGSKSNMVFLHE